MGRFEDDVPRASAEFEFLNVAMVYSIQVDST